MIREDIRQAFPTLFAPRDVNGRRVETLSTFVAELDRIGIDNTAQLTVVRNGKERKVDVRVVDLRK